MKLVRLLTFKEVGGGGDERILNGVYPFSSFLCCAVLVCVCGSALVSVWSKGDEPVRVGSKVLCNYEVRHHFEGVLEPVGIVVGHDGSTIEDKPWVVLTRFLVTGDYDYNYFCEEDLKVLDYFDSAEGLLVAIEDVAPTPSASLNRLLRSVSGQFGKLHKELENE